MEYRCDGCRYFEPESATVKGDMTGRGSAGDVGDCRRHPPTVLPGRQTSNIGGMSAPESRWPHVHKGDWCGEWANRRPPP
jgi:hypothetical protein